MNYKMTVDFDGYGWEPDDFDKVFECACGFNRDLENSPFGDEKVYDCIEFDEGSFMYRYDTTIKWNSVSGCTYEQFLNYFIKALCVSTINLGKKTHYQSVISDADGTVCGETTNKVSVVINTFYNDSDEFDDDDKPDYSDTVFGVQVDGVEYSCLAKICVGDEKTTYRFEGNYSSENGWNYKETKLVKVN